MKYDKNAWKYDLKKISKNISRIFRLSRNFFIFNLEYFAVKWPFENSKFQDIRPGFRYWHICHVDRHGHFTLKQLRLPFLNEMHTNSYIQVLDYLEIVLLENNWPRLIWIVCDSVGSTNNNKTLVGSDTTPWKIQGRNLTFRAKGLRREGLSNRSFVMTEHGLIP